MKSLAELSSAPISVLRSAQRPVRGPQRGQKKTRSDAMEEMGILSVLDLITHYPRRYLDRTTQVPISELTEGD